ncbi:uncharacterized protein BCR38DRAFT_31706 [Pseudomassariella vexata]|uniref:Uncharacterized protein n=1 Tax=Pseudomassariella vexata TaxID=1141098 RepID=A0A1Y2DPU8_9PEZI|nr:uncharacterized protein BCR38DRAFT_31706 [Pseudomassariella vexata]ORY61312.1 hypothetical protein BCR38DRAFT_31706 [Pseudomassariella vexata]
MSLSAPSPPLLLTKRLTSFLRSNLSPQIHTALLATLSGKLLAHASAQSVSILRTQCTIASSIWAVYSAPAAREAIPEAIPPHFSSMSHRDPTPSAVTIQLTGAVLVVRKLRCGLLFICIGPAPEGAEQEASTQSHGQAVQTPQLTGDALPIPTVGSPSEVESVTSVGAATTTSVTTTASISTAGAVLMRRQTEELARWLDDKLGGLGIPDEGPGMEGRQ